MSLLRVWAGPACHAGGDRAGGRHFAGSVIPRHRDHGTVGPVRPGHRPHRRTHDGRGVRPARIRSRCGAAAHRALTPHRRPGRGAPADHRRASATPDLGDGSAFRSGSTTRTPHRHRHGPRRGYEIGNDGGGRGLVPVHTRCRCHRGRGPGRVVVELPGLDLRRPRPRDQAGPPTDRRSTAAPQSCSLDPAGRDRTPPRSKHNSTRRSPSSTGTEPLSASNGERSTGNWRFTSAARSPTTPPRRGRR